jgi:hypothetical protein
VCSYICHNGTQGHHPTVHLFILKILTLNSHSRKINFSINTVRKSLLSFCREPSQITLYYTSWSSFFFYVRKYKGHIKSHEHIYCMLKQMYMNQKTYDQQYLDISYHSSTKDEESSSYFCQYSTTIKILLQ